MQLPIKLSDLNRLTLVQKLTMLGGIAVGSLLFIGIGYASLRFAESQFEDTSHKTIQFGDQIAQIEIEGLHLRQYEKDFYLKKDTKYLKQHDEAQKGLFDAINKARELAPESLRPTLDEVQKDLTDYLGFFKQTVDHLVQVGLNENIGLQGQLRTAVHNVEDIVTQQKELSLKVSMLQMRRREKDYMLRGDPVYMEKMVAEQKVFASALDEARLSHEDHNKIATLMDEYQKDFQAYVAGDQAQKAAAESARGAFNKLDPLLGQLAKEKVALLAAEEASLAQSRTIGNIIFAAVILLVMLIVNATMNITIRSIVTPLKHLMKVVEKIAQGDNLARANIQSADEIGALGRQFDSMLDQREANNTSIQKENETLNNSIIEMLQVVAKLAQRDLTVTAPVGEDITGPLGDALNLLSSETAKVLNQVVQIAGDVAKVSRQVKAQSDTVINIAAEEKREVAQSAAELSAASEAMLDIAKLALSCNLAAVKAIKNTDKAQETVLDTVQGITSIRNTIRETEKRIKRLGERSQEIGSVVTIINGISERTHILALNASMHAASAGEAGKGFAVVANEVQKLAENARDATSQISSLVNNIQVETADTVTTMNDAISQVVHGTTLAQQAGNEMRETRDATANLVQLVRRIAESSKIQAKTSQRLQERAAQIQKSTDQTYDQLQAQAVRTEKLENLSSGLVESVGVFTLPNNNMMVKVGDNNIIGKVEAEESQFNKSLIKNLVSDHRVLLTEFTGMMNSAQEDNFDEANRLLASFSTKLLEHLQLEMDELYGYMDFVEKMMTAEDKASLKGFDDEMLKIGHAVKNLIDRYTNAPVSSMNKSTFIKEFEGAGVILGDRIKREESFLYPLYGKYGRLS
jgi:methyl-accepting chemotaxis protein